MAGSESRGRGGRWHWRGREDEFSTSGPGLTEQQREQLSRVADELMKRYTITPKVPDHESIPPRHREDVREPEVHATQSQAEAAWGAEPELPQPEPVAYEVEAPELQTESVDSAALEPEAETSWPEATDADEAETSVETTEPVDDGASEASPTSLIDRWLHPRRSQEREEPAPQESIPAEDVEQPAPMVAGAGDELAWEPELEPRPEPGWDLEPLADSATEPEAVWEPEPEPEPAPLTREELSAALLEVFEFDSDWFIKEELPSAPELEFESSAVSSAMPTADDAADQPMVWSERELDDESIGDLESTRALLSEPVQMRAPEPPPAAVAEPEPAAEPERVRDDEFTNHAGYETEPGEDEDAPPPQRVIIYETETEMAEHEVAELEAVLESALGAEREAVERVAAARRRLDEAREALAALQELEA